MNVLYIEEFNTATLYFVIVIIILFLLFRNIANVLSKDAQEIT